MRHYTFEEYLKDEEGITLEEYNRLDEDEQRFIFIMYEELMGLQSD